MYIIFRAKIKCDYYVDISFDLTLTARTKIDSMSAFVKVKIFKHLQEKLL